MFYVPRNEYLNTYIYLRVHYLTKYFKINTCIFKFPKYSIFRIEFHFVPRFKYRTYSFYLQVHFHFSKRILLVQIQAWIYLKFSQKKYRGGEIYLKFLPIFFDWSRCHVHEFDRTLGGTATTWREISWPSTWGVVDRAAFNTQNHSSIENGTSLEPSKLLEFQESKPTVIHGEWIRFWATMIFVLRRIVENAWKYLLVEASKTVNNNGNMATLSQIVRFYWPHRTPRPTGITGHP